jgi:predicted transport protein
MFRLSHGEGTFIKNLFKAALAPLDVAPLYIRSEGVEVKGLSPDRLIMSILNISNIAFEEYQLSEEVSMLVDKEELLASFKRLTRRDKVTISYEDGARDLKIILINTKTGAEREFSAQVKEIGIEAIGDIQLELEVEAQISGEVFITLVKDAAVVGDELEIRLAGDSLRFISRGEDKEYQATLTQDKGLLSLSSRLENVSARYSIDLVKQVAKVLDPDSVVIMQYGPNKPLKLQASLGGGASLTYWITPRT